MRLSDFLKEHPKIRAEYRVVGNWIKDKLVEVDGLITTKNVRLNPYKAKVRVFLQNGWLELPYRNPNRQIILFYKPRGYLCTHSDPFARPIVYSLLPLKYQKLRSAGRLDQDSEGLMVFSNDGYFLHSIANPINLQTKAYLVGLESQLPKEFFAKAESGSFIIEHARMPTKLLPCHVFLIDEFNKSKFEYLNLETNLTWYRFELHEGRTNQIRQMCQQFDNPVVRLIRVQQASFSLSQNLAQGNLEVVE
jgi:pseudouridine synthase